GTYNIFYVYIFLFFTLLETVGHYGGFYSQRSSSYWSDRQRFSKVPFISPSSFGARIEYFKWYHLHLSILQALVTKSQKFLMLVQFFILCSCEPKYKSRYNFY